MTARPQLSTSEGLSLETDLWPCRDDMPSAAHRTGASASIQPSARIALTPASETG